jgi:hypothetical protein
MSSPPLSEPGNRAGLFYQAAGSFVSELACPRPWSRIRKHPGAPRFVLATWPSCRGTRELVASELAVVPSTTSGSPSLNTWPARPRHASSGHNLPLTRLRAIHRVPSYLAVRADPEHLTSPRSVAPPSRSKLAQRAGSVSITTDVGLIDIVVSFHGPIEKLQPLFKANPQQVGEENDRHLLSLCGGELDDHMVTAVASHIYRHDGTHLIHCHNVIFGIRKMIRDGREIVGPFDPELLLNALARSGPLSFVGGMRQ